MTGARRVFVRGVSVCLWYFLLVVVLAALAGCGGNVGLLGSLSESEANEVLGILLKGGVTASKSGAKTGFTISVDGDSMAESIELLHRHGLPRQRRSRMGEIFKKEGMISSPLEERARYVYALSQELEQTLSEIDGVTAARVHVVLPERLAFAEPFLPSAASVFIKHQKGYALESVVNPVRSLVANSIPGLAADRVIVVLVPAIVDSALPPARPSRLLFFKVDADSAPGLRLLLGALLAAVSVLAATTAYLGYKHGIVRKLMQALTSRRATGESRVQ